MGLFFTERWFDAPPEAVFAAIQNPTRLARWWGPTGFSNSFEVCDFRPGGLWRFTMHGPDGTDYPNECVFAEIVPNARVCIDHVVAPLFRLTITLTGQGGGTQLMWEQVLADPALANKLRHIIEPSNEQNLDRLGQELQAGG